MYPQIISCLMNGTQQKIRGKYLSKQLIETWLKGLSVIVNSKLHFFPSP